MATIRINVVETIHYSNDYDLEELEEFAGIKLDECEDLTEFAQHVQYEANNQESGRFAEHLERHGDVQGQVWTGEIIKGGLDD